jgi:hypothetical protein
MQELVAVTDPAIQILQEVKVPLAVYTAAEHQGETILQQLQQAEVL